MTRRPTSREWTLANKSLALKQRSDRFRGWEVPVIGQYSPTRVAWGLFEFQAYLGRPI